MSGDRLAKIERACHARIADKDLAPQLRGEARDVLALVEIAKAARVVGDMHESGEGFQWVGSEDDTEALDAICSALARLDSGAAARDAERKWQTQRLLDYAHGLIPADTTEAG